MKQLLEQFAVRMTAEHSLQITFCLQALVLPQMNLSRFAGEDVTVQDLGTVKGFNPNI